MLSCAASTNAQQEDKRFKLCRNHKVAPQQRYARNHALAAYIGVSVMTIRRWKADPALKTPPSMTINNISYNDLTKWDAWLKARAVSKLEDSAA